MSGKDLLHQRASRSGHAHDENRHVGRQPKAFGSQEEFWRKKSDQAIDPSGVRLGIVSRPFFLEERPPPGVAAAKLLEGFVGCPGPIKQGAEDEVKLARPFIGQSRVAQPWLERVDGGLRPGIKTLCRPMPKRQ